MEYVEFKQTTKKNKLYHIGKYSFSKLEIKHLIVAFFLILMTIFVSQFGLKKVIMSFLTLEFWIIFGIYFLTIGLGFIFHELGHKLVAQHYGFVSEFRADFSMLFIMLAISVFSRFILLAPGAVMIWGRPTIKQNGIISIAGPLINLILAIIFVIIQIIIGPTLITSIGLSVNAFLGIFNMLPFWVLDGKKVLNWSTKYYLLVMIPLVLIFVLNILGYF